MDAGAPKTGAAVSSVLFANKTKILLPCAVIFCYALTFFSISSVYDKMGQQRRMPQSFLMQQKLSLLLLPQHNATEPNHKQESIFSGTLAEGGATTWGVKWVFVVHLSGSQAQFDAITRTWAAAGELDEVAFVFFGNNNNNNNNERNLVAALPMPYHYSTTELGNEFVSTKAAFSLALRVYPFAEFFAKFDDNTYVYSRELIRQVRSLSASAHYFGYPMRPNPNASFTYASGDAGYILSRKAASLLHACTPSSDPHYEDQAVGLCMQEASIPLMDLVGLHTNHPFQMLLWNRHGNYPSDRARRMEPVEGFMNPLSYHFIPPEDMLRMHSPDHTFSLYPSQKKRRGAGTPHILHQFWESRGEGEDRGRPEVYMKKCKEAHSNWTYLVWNSRSIRERFPWPAAAAGSMTTLQYGEEKGRLINQEFYDKASELNLLSDILRYEVLLLYGGVYVDADMECFRTLDFLTHDHTVDRQAIGFLEKDEQYLNSLLGSSVIITSHAYSPLAVVLVAELQHTDWNLAPWQSAGPLYLTKIVNLFKEKIRSGAVPSYLDIQVLPSYHVFPFHFSDTRPDLGQLSNAIIQKDAVMDQKWGTTKGIYRDMLWREEPSSSSESESSITSSSLRLDEYVQRVHRLGLSPLAIHRPRWVIASVQTGAGMCNRIMNVLSTMAFALATGRVLLFDWEAKDPWLQHNQNEWMGHSQFEDIFLKPPFSYSFKQAKERFGNFFEVHHQGALTIGHDNTQFLRDLRVSDLDTKYPQSIIVVDRFDWWAAPLITSNPFYAESVFQKASSAEVFSELFRFVFRPRVEVQQPQPKCDWLVQYRAVWDRNTAPLKAFVECGRQHGMQWMDHDHDHDEKKNNTQNDNNNNNNNNNNNVLITDRADILLATEGEAIFGPSRFEGAGCRTGLKCDQAAVKTMYALSGCSHAVLTHTSTFGACIAGLWQMPDVYRVHADGSCTKAPYVDPIEAGVLDGQDGQISAVLSPMMIPEPKFAFVYLMVGPADNRVASFQRSVLALHTHFNHAHHYPIVVFVDDARQWLHMQFTTSARIHFVEVDPADWAVPQPHHKYPETFFLKSAPQHEGFPMEYRQMSRYAAGFLLGHPALARFDYVIKIDSDTFANGEWRADPFVRMHEAKARIGCWVSYSDVDDVTERLWETFATYLAAKKEKEGIILKQPGLLLDAEGRYRNTNLYGCFVGGRTAEFRSEEYRDLFRLFESAEGFFKYRWDEQKLFAFYAALYLEPEEMEVFDYVAIDHQNSASRWAQHGNRLADSHVSAAVVAKAIGY